eukprot:6198932-Pleurochrysis_carterae.AAC.1
MGCVRGSKGVTKVSDASEGAVTEGRVWEMRLGGRVRAQGCGVVWCLRGTHTKNGAATSTSFAQRLFKILYGMSPRVCSQMRDHVVRKAGASRAFCSFLFSSVLFSRRARARNGERVLNQTRISSFRRLLTAFNAFHVRVVLDRTWRRHAVVVSIVSESVGLSSYVSRFHSHCANILDGVDSPRFRRRAVVARSAVGVGPERAVRMAGGAHGRHSLSSFLSSSHPLSLPRFIALSLARSIDR